MVKVRRAKHTTPAIPNKRGPMNWNVILPLGHFEKVFTYDSHERAIVNANRIARGWRIDVYGLRGMCSRVALL